MPAHLQDRGRQSSCRRIEGISVRSRHRIEMCPYRLTCQNGGVPLCGGTTLYPGYGHRPCVDAGAARAPSTTHPRIYVSFSAPFGDAPRPRPRPAPDSSGASRRRLSPLGITALAIGALVVLLVLASDRKSTRLNSSHVANSYAVFCSKKKNKQAA